MSRVVKFVSAVAALLAISATPASAITNGVIDTDHPYVGVMAVEYAPGFFFHPCSGTLIAPRVFLVAAHCVAGLSSFFSSEQIQVTFDVNFFTASNYVASSELHFDPAFPGNQNDTHDLGVVILSRDVTEWNGVPIDPAQLPSGGLLDQLAAQGGLRNESFDNVGYGANAHFKGAPPSIDYDGYRKLSTSPFEALTKAYLQQLMNTDATGEGGVCYLDSGGPKFISDTDVVVAVQSQGDPHCRAHSIAYRIDTPQARAFLGQFVTLP